MSLWSFLFGRKKEVAHSSRYIPVPGEDWDVARRERLARERAAARTDRRIEMDSTEIDGEIISAAIQAIVMPDAVPAPIKHAPVHAPAPPDAPPADTVPFPTQPPLKIETPAYHHSDSGHAQTHHTPTHHAPSHDVSVSHHDTSSSSGFSGGDGGGAGVSGC